MTFEQLRLAHPRFVYRRYTVEKSETGFTFRYEFNLEPDIVFSPTVTIPYQGSVTAADVSQFAFHLGLVETISYWKAACPKELVVEAGMLTDYQLRFWYDLFIHGLGEFFYRNDIDFSVPGFLTIRNGDAAPPIPPFETRVASRESDLVLVGGGKDSAVTLGILKNSDRTIQTMILNPTDAAKRVAETAGSSPLVIVTRNMDPELFRLNEKGYLNGHTPFSAYLAFLGTAVAAMRGDEYVIVSNEKSANEGNVMFHGMEVNHQYSKSYRFEQQFREYVRDAFGAAPAYFSFLRPLNDVQISRIFSKHREYFADFRSCNVAGRKDQWCGKCPKCAFTYLTLRPFMHHADMLRIFGTDVLRNEEAIEQIRAIAGLMPVKPFECVGTRSEARLAVYMAVSAYLSEHMEVPERLLKLKSDLGLSDSDLAKLTEDVMENWADTFNLPPEHAALLRQAWEQANIS